jgi:hypothetical protein
VKESKAAELYRLLMWARRAPHVCFIEVYGDGSAEIQTESSEFNRRFSGPTLLVALHSARSAYDRGEWDGDA